MNLAEKNILKSYTHLLDGLSELGKIQLIDYLKESLKKSPSLSEKKFYDSFGSFASDQTAEELVVFLKKSRKFKKKELNIK
jgi:hypothetical protein